MNSACHRGVQYEMTQLSYFSLFASCLCAALLGLAPACSGDDDSGGAGTGGASGTGGSGGTGSGDGKAQCDAACSNSAGLQCPSDPDAQSCPGLCGVGRSFLLALFPMCGDEYDALNVCRATLPAEGFECDTDGASQVKDGYCPNENAALTACIGGDGREVLRAQMRR